MKYPLADLMFVREFREDKAATQVTKQRARVTQSENFVRQREQELQEYIAWRIRREKQMYDKIMQQPIQMKELDKVKESVQIMKDKEADYHDAVLQAQKELEEERTQLERDIVAHKDAVRNTDKLREHREIWQAEAAKEAEYNMEKELEDFRTREQEDDYGSEDDEYADAEEFDYV